MIDPVKLQEAQNAGQAFLTSLSELDSADRKAAETQAAFEEAQDARNLAASGLQQAVAALDANQERVAAAVAALKE